VNISIIIGYGGRQVTYLRDIAKEVESSLNNVNIKVMYIGDIDRGLEDLNFIKNADVVFIYSYTIPKNLEDILESIKDRCRIISIDLMTINISNVDFEVVKRCREYFMYGGSENYRRLILYLAKIGGLNLNVEDPVEIPWHGIYHPKLGIFNNIKDYLSKYYKSDKPLVGLLFYRSYWINNDLETVDKLIFALEDEDLGVIPVFTYGHRDPITGAPSKADSCREFFIKDGKVIIDFLIDYTSFFFANRPLVSDRFNVVSDEFEILKILDVPVMRPILMWYRSVEEWLNSEQGLDYLTQVYQVIMPEVDGLIEPIVVSGTCRTDSGLILGVKSVDEHVRYIAKRVKRWITLRRKSPSERKIAIVLHNAPCKGLEANIAIGLGLDVLESVVRVLKRLKDLGYNVENIPRDGKELAKLFLERRAISEFRWTSVEDIVSRGGVLDFVDIEEYSSWFEELPESVKKRMIETWGSIEELKSGSLKNVFVGMLYNGKFVIPGLKFGNVVVMLQPKFGCAGPRCDGRVCKILHDPTIPPPHQWLAVYRWISRKFKADLVIHFGTHGYLEFRPGKGVGLSWYCWPEISIDDMPHLYVYVVTNPMEGVIAKRRGYATIIDHVYPPMSIPEVFENLEDLLNQYSKAKSLGDKSRMDIIYSKIVEYARKLNIEVYDDPDKTIENIHRTIDLVKNTQINMGLHIFGCEYSSDRCVEYVLAILHKDSFRCPSIIRVILEMLGLDYDYVRSRPDIYIDKLGMTGLEVINKAREVARRVIMKLLDRYDVDDFEILRTILDTVREVFNISL